MDKRELRAQKREEEFNELSKRDLGNTVSVLGMSHDLDKYQMLWHVAKIVDFKANMKNTTEIGLVLKNSLSMEQAVQLRSEHREITDLLYRAYGNESAWDDEDKDSITERINSVCGGLGGDSGSDFINHVASLGQSFVKGYLDNDGDTFKYLKDYGYSESFSYCLPYKSDYEEEINHIKSAERVLKEAKEKLVVVNSSDELSESYKEKINKEVQPFLNMMDLFIKGELREIDKDSFYEQKKELDSHSNMATMLLANHFNTCTADSRTRIVGHAFYNVPKGFLDEEKMKGKEIDLTMFGNDYIKNYNEGNIEKNMNVAAKKAVDSIAKKPKPKFKLN